MKTTYNNGMIEIYVSDLLQSVRSETKIQLIEELSCDDEIIKHVADQIIDAWTENMSCGSSNCTTPAESSKGTPLDHTWRRVAKMSGEVAKREIEKLERQLKRAEERIEEYRLKEQDRINQLNRVY